MTGNWQDHGQGHQTCRMGDHLLEIKRNPDPHDRRRYYAIVDGEEVPTPTWSPSQAKTKAINAARRGYVTVRQARWQDRIEEPQALPEVYAQFTEVREPAGPEFEIEIRGRFNLEGFTDKMASIKSAVELLRELGVVECSVELPGRISL